MKIEHYMKKLRFCMDYCYHRLKSHTNTGLHGAVKVEDINFIRRAIGCDVKKDKREKELQRIKEELSGLSQRLDRLTNNTHKA